MEDNTFKFCSDYRRLDLDFNQIQREQAKQFGEASKQLYPRVMPHTQGSSYTYQISSELFFKRKQQDGNTPREILSQHHYNKAYNELVGSFDDLSEVVCYVLAKNIISPQTGKPIVDVAKYALASYTDSEGFLQRGCVSENVCKAENEELVSMGDILKSQGKTGKVLKTLEVYIAALEEFCQGKKIKGDLAKLKHDLVKGAYFCWKVANSDNHKNNITFIITTNADGAKEIRVSPLIDNSSAYDLSAPYNSATFQEKPRYATLLGDDQYSKTDENGNRVFAFSHYPYMHSAFTFEAEDLLAIGESNGRQLKFEYALACELLTDPELLDQVFEIEKQFNLHKMFAEIDEAYGSNRKGEIKANWPPLLQEFMIETNNYKSKTLARVVADYYFMAATAALGKNVNGNSPAFLALKETFLKLPLLPSKQGYDEVLCELAENFGVNINAASLAEIKFKREASEKQREPQ